MNKVANLVSFVIPLYNESSGLEQFHASLVDVIEEQVRAYELIYCDDGSTDQTAALVHELHEHNPHIKLVRLSRNFGKESALAAGIAAAEGDAILMLDGDGQHPVAAIPKFLTAWHDGAQVVVGVRTNHRSSGLKRAGSGLFYKLFNAMASQQLVPGSTDFRLIDREVREAFLHLHETDRITRGLIDWLGFRRELVYFKAADRHEGQPTYSSRKLVKLATDSLVSMTLMPLYIFGYLGVFITGTTFLLGVAILIEQLLLDDPWGWKFTGTAMLGILTLFLVGIVLTSQGILSLYISHIHTQSKRRPLYVIDHKASLGIKQDA